MVTVITKTIGPTGRDYATFALAEADTSNIGTSADLVANDEAIVFEADDTTFTTTSTLGIANTALTVDATRNVSYSAASGRPVYEYTGSSVGVAFYDPYTRWSGIDVLASSSSKATQVRANSGYGSAQAGTVIEKTTITAGTTAVACEKFATGHALGTSSEPITLRNVATKSIVAVSQFISGTGHTTGAHCLVVNCTHLGGASPNQAWNWALTGGMPDASFKIINCANLAQNTSNDANITGGGVDVSGSTNNIGNAAAPTSSFRFENIGGGIGAQYTPTTSFSTPLGSGDYAVYMGATGALADVTGNDVWQQGVGPGSNSDVPTTDINGVARSGASCNPGAFEADGFVAPTVITKTIGPSGRDYATFTLAEAAVTSIGSGTDLTFYNEAIVFEADAADYSGNFQFFTGGGLTCDATRNVTWTHATGAGHGGLFESGANIVGYCLIQEDFAVVDGLSVSPASGAASQIASGADGVILRNLMSYSTNNSAFKLSRGGTAAAPGVVENCVAKSDSSRTLDIRSEGAGVDSHWRLINCTVFVPTGYFAFNLGLSSSDNLYVELTNNLALGERQYFAFSGPTVILTGANNFGGSTSPFPAAIQGSPYPITASTAYDPGAGDFALYVSSTGQLLDSPHNDVIDGGVGPTVNADVPTTDIVGRARTRSVTNPGAFAVAQATRVVTKTIGPTGRDYATFTLAEAAVTTIATAEFGSTDLVANNGRIEFLADAATYSESVNFDSTVTTDATRQVTYKPAVGSEHAGVPGAGVRIQFGNLGVASVCVGVADPFHVLDGLELDWTDTSGTGRSCDVNWLAKGAAFRNLILRHAGTGVLVQCTQNRTTVSTDFPLTFENSVLRGSGHGFRVWNYGASDKAFTISNCTIECAFRAFDIFSNTDDTTYTITNNLILAASEDFRDQGGGGTSTVLGSNNFGPQTSATHVFPAAQKGSPYPITATTNTDPGPGHFAIYDADTGALVNVAANTVWQRGVGPSANSDVPTTDIAGFTRSGATANPGAFAASTSLAQTTNPVARFFTYKRPSSQLFNHHRRVTCVFPDDGPSGNANTFAVGVATRGFISPVSRDCVAFFVYYTTDGAGGQTSLRLEVARIVGQYSQDAIAEAQPIAVVEKQAVGEAIPAGFDFPGQSHTVAFKVQTFSGATTPESAAEYTAYIDGTAVTFDTFYQSATQDGTTKVVTHPAPAVGTTQGRAEAFFWYATADRTDSVGSENYALPQWSDWNQLAVDPDPIFDGEGQSITVQGEGTGTVNFSTALEHVDFAISVQYELPRFDTPFASGHRYTSPRFENSRRVITASATNIDKATMDLIVQFHAARKGIEEPFLFNFPIPDTTTSETYTVITVQFADTAGMVYRRDAENIYSVQLNMIELL